jgi:hypothetical protein
MSGRRDGEEAIDDGKVVHQFVDGGFSGPA